MQEKSTAVKTEIQCNQPQVGGRRPRARSIGGPLDDGSDPPPRRRRRRDRELPTQVGVFEVKIVTSGTGQPHTH